MSVMTMDDIRKMKDDFLPVDTVAQVLRINPDRLRGYLRNGELDVTVRKSGQRIMISRESLLNWYEGKKPEPQATKTEQMLEQLTNEIRVQNAVLMGLLVHFAPEISDSIINKCEEIVH